MPPHLQGLLAELASIERDLDLSFERELRLTSIPKAVAREAILDVAEKLLTGQGKQIDEDSGALTLYFNNVTNGASSALRAVERFAPDESLDRPGDWDPLIRQCISTCFHFALVEDAFFTYWKGYSTATALGRDVVFEPVGTPLDARLRFFRSDGDFSEADDQFNSSILTSRQVMNGVARSMKRTKFRRVGGFNYQIEKAVVDLIAAEFERVLGPSLNIALDIDLGGVTSRDLFRAWCVLLALARLHLLVRLLTSKDPKSPETSYVFPALYRQKKFWLDALAGLPNPSRLLEILTFDPQEKPAMSASRLSFKSNQSITALSPRAPCAQIFRAIS